MTHLNYLLYLELRKQRKIGRLWVDAGQLKLAPLDALVGFEYQLAEWVSEESLIRHMEQLKEQSERKGPMTVSDYGEIEKVERYKYKVAR